MTRSRWSLVSTGGTKGMLPEPKEKRWERLSTEGRMERSDDEATARRGFPAAMEQHVAVPRWRGGRSGENRYTVFFQQRTPEMKDMYKNES
jgi:hypothetical protein